MRKFLSGITGSDWVSIRNSKKWLDLSRKLQRRNEKSLVFQKISCEKEMKNKPRLHASSFFSFNPSFSIFFLINTSVNIIHDLLPLFIKLIAKFSLLNKSSDLFSSGVTCGFFLILGNQYFSLVWSIARICFSFRCPLRNYIYDYFTTIFSICFLVYSLWFLEDAEVEVESHEMEV